MDSIVIGRSFVRPLPLFRAADSAPRPRLAVVEGGSTRRVRFRRPRPLDQPPLITYLLLIAMALVFAAMYWIGHGQITQISEAFGRKDNDLIRAGEWWRFVTPIFLHGSLSHIVVNSMSLYWLGSELEVFYGRWRYFLVFMTAGIMGNVVSFLLKPAPSLGASGAIFGLVGAAIIFPLRFRALLPEKFRTYILTRMGMVAAINLGIGFAMPNIVDNWAHLGGLVGGGMAALFLKPEALNRRADVVRFNENLVKFGAALMLILVVVCGWKQWRSVVAPSPALMVRYPADQINPWFSLSAPITWKRQEPDTRIDGSWVSPEGGILTVTDSAHDLQTVEEELAFAGQSGAHEVALSVAGKPARHGLVRTPQAIADIYVIQPFPDRVVSLLLRCRPENYALLQPSFQRLIDSIRFPHPPTD